jgi:hypothetical protein
MRRYKRRFKLSVQLTVILLYTINKKSKYYVFLAGKGVCHLKKKNTHTHTHTYIYIYFSNFKQTTIYFAGTRTNIYIYLYACNIYICLFKIWGEQKIKLTIILKKIFKNISYRRPPFLTCHPRKFKRFPPNYGHSDSLSKRLEFNPTWQMSKSLADDISWSEYVLEDANRLKFSKISSDIDHLHAFSKVTAACFRPKGNVLCEANIKLT